MDATPASALNAALWAGKHGGDEVYIPGRGPQGGEFYLPYRALRDGFARHEIALHTPDLLKGRPIAFDLHVNARHVLPAWPAYAYLYEDPLVRPVNGRREHLQQYRKVFTYNADLVDGERFIQLDIPNDLRVRSIAPWAERELFCVMLTRNNALSRPHPDNLHYRRLRTLQHFEAHAPELFALFGRGWDQAPVRPGVWGRAVKRLRVWRNRIAPGKPPFATWRGPAHTKGEVLSRARFAIAYENARGVPGYITEKIFDCFVWGCVPVYLGTPGATAAIPRACFIDADEFADEAQLLRFLRSVTPQQHRAYQAAIADFLASPAAQRYGNEHFARVIVDTIVADLGLAAPPPSSA
ncbi:MAG: glycosyltransferase family 10 domain-containing protein [Rubrivivax sp.]